jgi:hypothetical protein
MFLVCVNSVYQKYSAALSGVPAIFEPVGKRHLNKGERMARGKSYRAEQVINLCDRLKWQWGTPHETEYYVVRRETGKE